MYNTLRYVQINFRKGKLITPLNCEVNDNGPYNNRFIIFDKYSGFNLSVDTGADVSLWWENIDPLNLIPKQFLIHTLSRFFSLFLIHSSHLPSRRFILDITTPDLSINYHRACRLRCFPTSIMYYLYSLDHSVSRLKSHHARVLSELIYGVFCSITVKSFSSVIKLISSAKLIRSQFRHSRGNTIGRISMLWLPTDIYFLIGQFTCDSNYNARSRNLSSDNNLISIIKRTVISHPIIMTVQ